MVANIDRRYWMAALILILLMAFFAGLKYGDHKNKDIDGESIVTANPAGEREAPEVSEVKVYICGEVENPGVYKLKDGARVYDALMMAGILPAADLKTVQPARKLQDGETIELLAEGESDVNSSADKPSLPGRPPTIASPAGTGLVNINTASAQELDGLPGIGPALAQRIIDYRTANGPFATIDDINNVSGIGEKKFAALKDLITVR
ncbi:Competence protein ComEA, helix-hairpin-helix domain [Syntrophomonas zehnderi OL-4]|uniref:Competence protein ComEA, helix-hairpin-helix domain n=1 Tax=Syntrophomonas zehnderi OL-4 TaxID=690567 RepID=A0A0E3W3F8_9FIRM|nr:helix-hairpin-helix domain-containing protein [Syntrophomonas zehnderi]CFX79575.1 Competence protein ComEA, helix-hairpin-helix domain [Syntrophomonas zehnderi OL-4]